MNTRKLITQTELDNLLEKPYKTLTTDDIDDLDAKSTKYNDDWHTTLTAEQALAGIRMETAQTRKMKLNYVHNVHLKLLQLGGGNDTEYPTKLQDLRDIVPGSSHTDSWKLYYQGDSIFNTEQREFIKCIVETPLVAYAPIFLRFNKDSSINKRLERVLIELLWKCYKADHPDHKKFMGLLNASLADDDRIAGIQVKHIDSRAAQRYPS